MSIEKSEIIYVAIIEDNKYIRQGWEMSLGNEPDFKVVGSFESCEDAFLGNRINEADIVLMDIGLPGMSGIEGIKYLKEKYPDLLIVMCTVHDENEEIFEAICAGAIGYLLKKISAEDLASALRDAYNGGSPMTPAVARKVISAFQKADEEKVKLTEREMDILKFMSAGKSYSAIAKEIFLSLDGVYYHIRHIYEKLHVHSRSEAVAKGIKKRLIPPLG
jgi:DNA-binding NarL/FixJ family response regulator